MAGTGSETRRMFAVTWVLVVVVTLALVYVARRVPACAPESRYFYVRDTIVVRDTVRVRIPEQRIRARLPARKMQQRYVVDTVLATGESVRIAFVEDSVLFDVDVVVPARDTAIPRAITVVAPAQPVPDVWDRGAGLPLLVGALAVGVIIGVLLR